MTPPPADSGGVELAPQEIQKNSTEEQQNNDVGWNDVPEFEPMAGEIDASRPPLLMGLEPSVLSLRPGEKTILQVIVRGGEGSYRLPFAISYDPHRVVITSVDAAPGVEILRNDIYPGDGWIDLDLVVSNGLESGQGVVALHVQAIDAGPAPLIFTSVGAVTADGAPIPVAASDGALFVNGNGQVREEP